MRGYKVCIVNSRGAAQSAIVKVGPGEPGRKYPIGEMVKPKRKCGPFGVFKRLCDAKAFRCYGGKIYQCEYTKSTETRMYNARGRVRDIFVRGTVLASSVTLTKLLRE